MANNFITNNKQHRTLKGRLNTLISISDELKFLVGFFYFRKTQNPNHAKLYLFRLNEEQANLQGMPGQFVTGSSNLTRAGLSGQEVLKTYLELQQQKRIKPEVERILEEVGFKKYAYQIDAVNQALSVYAKTNCQAF